MLKPIVLPNGLRVHLVPFEGTEAVTVLVLTAVGSRHESAELNGAAHFIEHLMFKGTEKRPTMLDLSRQLDAVGAEYNAYTGKDLTGYYVKVDAKHQDLAVDLLHDMLFHSLFDQTELDRERSVIKEEINMYEDNPIMHVEELLEASMFDGSTLGRNIAGTHATMDAMPREGVIAFRDAHYRPDRMVVAVSGRIGPDLERLIASTFGAVPAALTPPAAFEPFAHPASRAREANVQFKETQQIQLMLGFPGYGYGDPRVPAAKLLSTILGGTMSSRLFIEVRERRGLAYMVRASHDSYEDTGLLTIQAGLDRSRLPLACETILGEARKLVADGVTETELKEAKDHLYGKTMLRLEDSSDRAEWFARQELFRSEAKTVAERMEELQAVTLDDIVSVAKDVLDTSRMGIAAVGPFKTGEDFLKEAKLL